MGIGRTVLLLSFACSYVAAGRQGYVGGARCGACHAAIASSYRLSGMARSFARAQGSLPDLDANGRAAFYHAASRRWYTLERRGSTLYLRRHQVGFEGKETNVLEASVDYVLGSGNHARALVHRTPDGRLIQLPVAWYAEDGTWAMAPGYDRPDHSGFRRAIDSECLFCHNAYPRETASRREMPEGIDCERCHGPGEEHIRAVEAGLPAAAIRAAILNPARLSPERQLEVCMQCHLESTSRPLPYSVRRVGRAVFSYDPREPLAAYALFFDRASPHDTLEVNHSAYRLRQSQCFRASGGRLVCTTCHNPHDAAQRRYDSACRDCHTIK